MTLGNISCQRVVNAWNGLSQFVVDPETVNSFKNRLDKFDSTLWKASRITGKTGCPQADYGLLNQYKQVKLS